MNKITNLFIIVLLCGIATQLKAEVKLSTVFGNHMVLQQQAKVTFKGYTDANKRVKVTVGWNTKKYAVVANASGYFEITVQIPESVAKPYEISFNDGKELRLKNKTIHSESCLEHSSGLAFRRLAGTHYASMQNAKTELQSACSKI